MLKFLKIPKISVEAFESIGFTWHQDTHREYAVKEELLVLSEEEAQAYYDAANTLYEMYEKAAEYVINNNLFDALDIPKELVNEIKRSWEAERENHLYGRFDLSGGIDSKPIKLIEFNADTPTMLLESTLVQWMLLESAKIENSKQFNSIYESITKKIKKITQQKGIYSRMLFSSVASINEEIQTVKLLCTMAKETGCLASYETLEAISLSEEHVLDKNDNSYDYWFKLYPWEEMLAFETVKHTAVLNPAFTLLYQSKGMLAILYKLFPDSPYLLQTDFKPIKSKYVKKRMFGREGANIEIIENERVIMSTDGIYDEYKAVYQEYVDFVQDAEHNYYQAGVFYSDEACGIGFRRGAEILDDRSQFIGHIVST